MKRILSLAAAILFISQTSVSLLRAESAENTTVDFSRLYAHGFQTPASEIQAPRLRVMEGDSQIDLSRSNKAVLIYFWSYSVPASLTDLPLLQELPEEVGDENVIIAAVNLNDDYGTVLDVLKSRAPDLTPYVYPNPADLEPYILRSVPCAYLLYPGGRVAASVQGNAPWTHEDLIRSLSELAAASK